MSTELSLTEGRPLILHLGPVLRHALRLMFIKAVSSFSSYNQRAGISQAGWGL